MTVLMMTKLRNLRVMGTRKRRKTMLRKRPKRWALSGLGQCQGWGPCCLAHHLLLWCSQSGKKRNRKRSGDDSFDEGSVSESESESENGHAEEKEEAGG